MTTPIATNPRPPITIAAMSGPAKASSEDVTGVALAVAVAVHGPRGQPSPALSNDNRPKLRQKGGETQGSGRCNATCCRACWRIVPLRTGTHGPGSHRCSTDSHLVGRSHSRWTRHEFSKK